MNKKTWVIVGVSAGVLIIGYVILHKKKPATLAYETTTPITTANVKQSIKEKVVGIFSDIIGAIKV